MRFLLDANVVIAVLNGNRIVLDRLRQHALEDFAVPTLVIHELCYGASKSAWQAENQARIDAMRFAILDFDAEDARQAGEVRAVLEQVGTPIGAYDVLIAGQALARDLILVTHSTRKFERVAGLRTADWEG